MIEALNDSSAMVRAQAAFVLGDIGPAAKTSIPQLAALTNDRIAIARSHAAAALGKMKTGDKTVIQALSKLCKDESSMVRKAAVNALGYIGSEARPALPALIELSKDSNSDLRLNLIGTLVNIGYDDKLIIPALLDMSKDTAKEVRKAATYALSNVKLEPTTAIKEFARLSNDHEFEIRLASEDILDNFEESAIAMLVELLKAPEANIKDAAAQALARIEIDNSESVRPHVPALIEALDCTSKEVCSWVAFTLGNIGPVATAAIPKRSWIGGDGTGRGHDRTADHRNLPPTVERVCAAACVCWQLRSSSVRGSQNLI